MNTTANIPTQTNDIARLAELAGGSNVRAVGHLQDRDIPLHPAVSLDVALSIVGLDYVSNDHCVTRKEVVRLNGYGDGPEDQDGKNGKGCCFHAPSIPTTHLHG